MLTTHAQTVQGKTKFFALYLQLFYTFEIISRVKIMYQKKGKREIRDNEYRPLFQEVMLQSRNESVAGRESR